jgi:hypothetical protein
MNSTTIRISKKLVDAAKECATWTERSVPGQIEHWALLGKALEGQLPADSAMALKKAASDGSPAALSKEVTSAFSLLQKLHVGLPKGNLAERLARKHPVRYGGDPDHPGYLIQFNASGKRTKGKLVGRKFVPVNKK